MIGKTTRQSQLLYILFFLCSLYAGAQQFNTFDVRYQNNLKGDLTLIGNNILNRDGGNSYDDPNDAYNTTGNSSEYNDNLDMRYIDVDGDPSTFSSSKATLVYPNATCNKIRYAGLYWAATYPSAYANQSVGTDRQSDFDHVRLKVPGGSYVNITADDILYDGFTNSSLTANSPYACYADVTSLLTAMPDPQGEYTVANVRSVQGQLSGRGGASAGWTLVIVYENPTLTGKLITTFDGFAQVNGTNSVDIDYNGFNTIPVGPVRANIGAAALEGDNKIVGDRMRIKASSMGSFTTMSNTTNPADNFFNSNITLNGSLFTARVPNSSNTLGFDADLLYLNNPSNSVIPNNETSATFQFQTNGDQYYPFFNSFNIEIIEPNITLEKRVEDIAGNDITGQGVHLGQQLDYVLTFKNIGNDDATNYTIRDHLPINVSLIPANMVLPTGVTYTYDSVSHEVTFSIPDNLVEVGDPEYSIRMRVKVAENCFDFIDACSDLIQNLAYSSYAGVINNNPITDDPSVSDFDSCGFPTPGATNFLLDDLADCNYSRIVQMCGDNVILDAGDNFDEYIWYRDVNNNQIIDGPDVVITDGDPDNDPSTIRVTQTGSYIVDKKVADPCKGFKEFITVENFGSAQTNPIADLINDPNNTVEGEVVICPNDGEPLPKIFLCGLNDVEPLSINIPDALSIQWEKLDEGTCSASIDDCANKNGTCTWNSVGTGSTFLASDAGQYRLIINYQNGCFTRFYFNIFKNPLDPKYTSRDLICGTPGNITVTNVPAGYEYQLLDGTTGNILVPYTTNNSFSIATPGAYSVEIRQQGVIDGCIFRLDDIGIRQRNFQVDVTTQDTNCNGLGEIAISVLDVEPQYYYEISQGGSIVDTYGPSADNNYTFESLNSGVYDVKVTTDDGCVYNEQVTINQTADLDLTARVSQNITCKEGNIQMESTGGQTPHVYAIWKFVDEGGNTVISYPSVTDVPASEFQTSVIFDILVPGDYTFIVVDKNNCFDISNTVNIQLVPAVEFTSSVTDETCFGAADGSIVYNLVDSHGYQVDYTITYPDGITTVNNASGYFDNLPQGTYSIAIHQRKGSSSCDYIDSLSVGGPADGVSGNAVQVQGYDCTQNAIIEAQNVMGGTAPYEYSIDGVNFGASPTFSNLTAGTYSITIRDGNGCTFVTNSIVVPPVTPPNDLVFNQTPITCPANTVDVNVQAIQGTAPFTFEIIAPITVAQAATANDNIAFTNLSPGTYTFRVTDANGCSYQETYTIAPIVPMNLNAVVTAPVTCFGANDGAMDFTVAYQPGQNFSYTISGPSGNVASGTTTATISLTNLEPGTYTFTVTDTDTNCVYTDTFDLEGPPSAMTFGQTVTQPTCTNSGSVVVVANGGWGSCTYELVNPDSSVFGTNTTGSFSNLVQTGTYTINVTDANGCALTDTFTLDPAIAPVLEIVPNDPCYDDAVGLTLTANVLSGGDGSFEYSLNGGAFTSSNTFTGLNPGTYTITVRDGKDCTDTANITVDPELSLVASASPITSCATATNVNITASGGDGNYVYAVVPNGTSPSAGDFGAANPVSVTGAGDYDVYVRDNGGAIGFCEAQYDITITQDPPLVLTASNTPVVCSGSATATITLTASGGLAPYTYSINNGATYQTSNSFVNQPAGSYNVVVRDANGCTVSDILVITEPFTLSASAAITELVECNPVAGAEVRITNAQGGTAPYEYSFDGGLTYGASPIGNLLPGTHTLYVRDSMGCDFPMTVTIAPAPTPPNVTPSIDYECDGEGTITLTPDSASFDYTYALDGTLNTPDTSNIFANVAPGTHNVTVTYVQNTPPPASILLSETFGAGANTSITEVDPAYCYEPQNGLANSCGWSINTEIQDGEYSVTHTIVNPYGTWLNPNDHTGLANGRFLAMNVGGVVGPNGIIYAKRNIEVIPNRDITISLWAFNLLRNGQGGADPDITIQLVDGSGNVINSTTTGAVPKNNDADDWQNYPVTLNPAGNTNLDIVIRTNNAVTGGNDIAIDDIEAFQYPESCPGTLSLNVTVEDGHAFGANTIATTDITCNGDSDGSITFEVENFDPVNGFVYAVDGGALSAPQTSSPITVSGLAAGTHTISVQDALDNSCATVLTETLTEPNPLVPAASVTAPYTCNNTGATITASATGGSPAYFYQLEDTSGGVVRSYQNSAVFNNITDGDYVVRIRDTHMCENTVAVTVDAPQSVVFTATPTDCYSGNSDATIMVDVTDGNGGYQFRINGGPWIIPNPSTATTYTFTNLVAGTYTVEVRDQYGCPAAPQNITINPKLNASAHLDQDLTCLVDGEISINATGGSGSYTYEWSNDGGATYNSTGFTGNVFTTNTDGTFQFRVSDTSSPTCTVITNSVVITPAIPPVISNVVPTPVLCSGGDNGSLAVTIDTSVGVPPYTINVVNSTTSTNYGTQRFGLPAGDYVVTVTDAKGCVSDPFPVSITEPDPVTYDIVVDPIQCDTSTSGINPGSITVQNVTGGTQEYTYYVTSNNGYDDNYTTTAGGEAHTFDILEFGIYYVSVVDANGCSSDVTEVIASPPSDLIIDVTTPTVDCLSGGTAIVSVDATVGSNNYEFGVVEFFYPPYTNNYQDADSGDPKTATITGLIPGVIYSFVVHDKTTDCYYLESAEAPIPSPSNMTVNLDQVNNVTCKGMNDGSVTFTIDNFDATATAVDYEIFNAQVNTTTGITGTLPVNPPSGPLTVPNFGPLPPGEYYVLIKELGGAYAGCSVATTQFTIRESAVQLQLTASSPQNDNCILNAGSIAAVAQYGTAPYTYQYLPSTDPAPTATDAGWTSSSSAQVESGDYMVYVKDANNCIQSVPVTVALDPSPEISLNIVDECVEEGNFEVEIHLDNPGMTPYQLSVNGGTYQNISFDGSGNYVVSGLSSGLNQSFAVRDLNGCGETETVNIYPPLEFTALLTEQLDCEPGMAANAEITVDVISGSGSYQYIITDPDGTVHGPNVMTGSHMVWTQADVPGDYQITVYDLGTAPPNCEKTVTVTAPPKPMPLFTETHIDVSCNGANDGGIALLETDNGIGPLTYEIAPVAGTFNAATTTFENLPPGTYTITATGTNNCKSFISGIVIGEPDPIANVNVSVGEFGCTMGNNPNNATLTIDTASITGGTGNYVIYEFINNGSGSIIQTGSNPVYTETNTAGGSYTINVYDDHGCVGSTTATILPYDALLSFSAAVTQELSCSPGMDGEITLTVTSTAGDASKYEFSVDNGATWQTSNVFSGMDAGNYTFLVRHMDTGCIMTTTATLLAPKPFTVDVNKIQDVICYGTETGEVTLHLVDPTYTGSFNWIIWDTNGTLADTSDDISYKNGTFSTTGPTGPITLVAGSYWVELTQNGFPACTGNTAFTINGPSAPITGTTIIDPITCVDNGAITITNVMGGWGNYSYYVGTTAPTGPSDYVNNPYFNNLVAGTYEAWVRDVNGCEEMVDSNLVLTDPTPITASLQINQENCIALQGEIQVVGTTGGQGSNYSYQLIKNGTAVGSPQASDIFSGLGAGTYEVTVTDQWGCSFTTPAVLLYEEMHLVPTVVKVIDCTSDPGGQITIAVNGGSSNLEYTVTFPDGTTTMTNTTGIFTGLTQVGPYSFMVTDLDTTAPACTKTVTQALEAPSVTEISLTDTEAAIVNVSCHGLNDGSIRAVLTPTVAGINANPPYTYNLYDAGGSLLQTSSNPLFTGLAAAIYQVEAISALGCSDRETVEVTEPTELQISATATSFVCQPNNTAAKSTVTVTVEDGLGTPGIPSGTGTYQYSLDGGPFQLLNTFTVSDTGSDRTLTLVVRDANGCEATTTVALKTLNKFTATVTQDVAITCPAPEQVTITVSDNGDPTNTYTYELLPLGNTSGTLIANPSNVQAQFELLAPGSYTFRITDDATGCYVDTAAYTIAPYDLIDVTATATAPVQCFAAGNGSLEFTVANYSGAFDYEVRNQAGALIQGGSGNTSTNPFPITGLSGGNYYVTVTETGAGSSLCSDDSNIVKIESPDMPLTGVVQAVAPVTCTDDKGELLVDPSGGYAPYDITITHTVNGQTYNANGVASYVFGGLGSGTYNVVVTDAHGCIWTDQGTLDPATPMTASIMQSTAMVACYGDSSASIWVNSVSGGSGSYKYQLLEYTDASATTISFTGGPQATPNFDNLGAGTYGILITDGWDCDITVGPVTIGEPTEIHAGLAMTVAPTCMVGGTVRLTVSGGTAPYSYSEDGVNFTAMIGTTHDFTNVLGPQQFYVRDVNGCISKRSGLVDVDPVLPLELTLDDSAANIYCAGEETAMIVAHARYALGNYQYELFKDDMSNRIAGPTSNNTFSGLGAGTYFIRASSGPDCEDIKSLVITEPAPLQVDEDTYTNVSCAGEGNGTINVTVSGGTGTIYYAISPNLNQFSTKHAFTDLEPGTYTVIAQDENGCFIPFQYVITEPQPLEITATTVQDEVCAGSADGAITIAIGGGTAPYETAFNSNDDAAYGPAQYTYTDLATGTYVIFTRDANGCESNVIVEVGAGANLNAQVTPVYGCDNNMPSAEILVAFEDPSVAADVLYALDSTDPADMQLDYDFGNIVPGHHFLTISHANGCMNTVEFDVETTEPLTLTLENNEINLITAVASGGTGDYTYTFDSVSTGSESQHYIKKTDTHTVTVTDSNGCTATAQLYVEFIDIEIPNFFTPDFDNVNDFWKPLNTQQYPKILTRIFDRYGRVVYKMGPNVQGWDGLYNGKPLPTGDYWYVIKLNGEDDEREFVGHFTLYR